jgi:hypothetical protein
MLQNDDHAPQIALPSAKNLPVFTHVAALVFLQPARAVFLITTSLT